MEDKPKVRVPDQNELTIAIAKMLFGNRYWKTVVQNLPWSLLVAKAMWKKGEEPWRAK